MPAVLDELEDSFDAGPAEFLRELMRRLVAVWERPRVRRVMDLFIREGGYRSLVGRTDVASARREGLRRDGALFARWREAGLVDGRFRPEGVAWELISPVASIRILHFHGAASEPELEEGRRLAGEHVEFFIAHVVAPAGATLPAGPVAEARPTPTSGSP